MTEGPKTLIGQEITQYLQRRLDALEAIVGPLREEIERLREQVREGYTLLQLRAEEAEAEVERLREALDDLAYDAETPQKFYDSNGPQWTSEEGNEYEDTSAFLAKCNELAATARAALAPQQGGMRDG